MTVRTCHNVQEVGMDEIYAAAHQQILWPTGTGLVKDCLEAVCLLPVLVQVSDLLLPVQSSGDTFSKPFTHKACISIGSQSWDSTDPYKDTHIAASCCRSKKGQLDRTQPLPEEFLICIYSL